ncbi:hypothetical protein [Geopsychrobacter electrodiphilus]|uniref:hypothetical protein n=1 Tax=Geopsychrobacter electrodiphilus TaxID=225196 RepID=UPI00036F20CC|nr:hypothetical protein [Geopsychrobacter electrodiphilus]
MTIKLDLKKIYGPDSTEADELYALINQNAAKLKKDWKGKLETLEKTLQVIASGRETAEKLSLPDVEKIWNVSGYINVCSFDLAIIGEKLMFEPDMWQKRFYARHAAVILYEASQDLPKIINKEFRESVLKMFPEEQILEEINPVIKEINKFKKENHHQLKDIRIVCSAHRHNELDEQLRIVFNLQPVEILKLCGEFDRLLCQLGGVLQIALVEATNKINLTN